MSRPRALLLVLASLISVVSQATIAAENSGLVADWSFDETEGDVARDASGNGNDLKLHGAQLAKDGQGSSVRLDGLGAYAECALSNSMKPKQAVTVEAWVKPMGKPWGEPDIFGASNVDYQIGYSNRGSCWWFIGNHGNEVGGKIEFGRWNHLVGTFDGTTRIMWVNGLKVGARPARALSAKDGRFIIGSNSPPFFNGFIDNLRIYNRVISPAEAIAHYRAQAADHQIDPVWFTRVKVQPYFYFDRGEVVIDADYTALQPLEGKGSLQATLSTRKEPNQILDSRKVDLLPSWGNTDVTFPLSKLSKDQYLIRVTLKDDKSTRPVEEIPFDYPPAPQSLPRPDEKTVAALPKPPAQIPFSVELSKSGGFRLKVKDVSYGFESKISWPNGDFNHLSTDDSSKPAGERSWNVEARTLKEGNYEVAASGSYYAIHRQIQVLPTHVMVEDTYTNMTDQDIGLLIYNELPLKEKRIVTSRLCGYEGGGRCVDVLSPHYGGASVFLNDGNIGLGLLPMDDVFVVQSLLYIEKQVAGMGTEQLALPANGSFTLKWAIYPTGSGDYYDFINTFRTVENRIGTVHGGLGFISFGPKNRKQVPDADFIKNRGIQCAMLHGLTASQDNPGISLQGIEFIDFPKECALLRDQAAAIHAAFPNLKVVFHIAHTLYSTNQPDRYADSKLVGPNGKQHISGGPADFSTEATGQGWAYHTYYPTPGNSFHDAMMKSVDVMMDQMGFDGAFVDGFLLGYGGRWTYDRWDGHSADIDPKSKTIKQKKGSVLLLMQPSMVEYARKIRDKGGIVIANGSVITPTITKEKYLVFDAEAQAEPECHLSPNAMSLSWGPFLSEKELYMDVLDKLSWGVLYMFYNDRIPLTHLSLAAKEFPITFDDIRAGCVRGNQRIVTMNSGVYGWRSDHHLHRVFKFDSRGAPADNTFLSTSDSDGARTELTFAEHVSAVIERIPASFTSNGPVNVLVKDYEPGKLTLLANGRGEATLTVFVGTSYPDHREGVFTDGGVSPLQAGVGDPYAVTINDKTTTLQERDGILSVPIKLDGQSNVLILRSQRQGKE